MLWINSFDIPHWHRHRQIQLEIPFLSTERRHTVITASPAHSVTTGQTIYKLCVCVCVNFSLVSRLTDLIVSDWGPNGTVLRLIWLISQTYLMPTGVGNHLLHNVCSVLFFFKLSNCFKSSASTSYTPCHITLLNLSAHSPLSCVLPIISGSGVPPCQDAKLASMTSLHLILPLFQWRAETSGSSGQLRFKKLIGYPHCELSF